MGRFVLFKMHDTRDMRRACENTKFPTNDGTYVEHEAALYPLGNVFSK
jgi:hypothetical protein